MVVGKVTVMIIVIAVVILILTIIFICPLFFHPERDGEGGREKERGKGSDI